jgi:hypothetical protein
MHISSTNNTRQLTMTQVIILHLTHDGQECALVFHSIRAAYDCLEKIMRELFPNDPTVFIEPFDYVANEICERMLISEGLLTPTAWNETKSWKASLAKTYIIEESTDLFS